jgi:hypothetical protein
MKLIPKKGNSSDIKKWRPISLLSCLYKIISRAINNRLKSVVNRFTSRAQKGFTKHRYIQEVLINVCETIRHCDVNNVGVALVSVDQSRAFDTISHKYMSEVYKFFGFGVKFVNMIDTLGNNRNASIIFEDGTISKNFELETGRPQGDGPSPLQYNMGEEILPLKIELDPLVASVFQHAWPLGLLWIWYRIREGEDLTPTTTITYLRNLTGKLTKLTDLLMIIRTQPYLIMRA